MGDIRTAIWNMLTWKWLSGKGFPSMNDVPARDRKGQKGTQRMIRKQGTLFIAQDSESGQGGSQETVLNPTKPESGLLALWVYSWSACRRHDKARFRFVRSRGQARHGSDRAWGRRRIWGFPFGE